MGPKKHDITRGWTRCLTQFWQSKDAGKKWKIGQSTSFDFLSHPPRLSTGDNEGGDKPEDVEALIER